MNVRANSKRRGRMHHPECATAQSTKPSAGSLMHALALTIALRHLPPQSHPGRTSTGLLSLVLRDRFARVPRKTWPKPPLPSLFPVRYTGEFDTWTCGGMAWRGGRTAWQAGHGAWQAGRGACRLGPAWRHPRLQKPVLAARQGASPPHGRISEPCRAPPNTESHPRRACELLLLLSLPHCGRHQPGLPAHRAAFLCERRRLHDESRGGAWEHGHERSSRREGRVTPSMELAFRGHVLPSRCAIGRTRCSACLLRGLVTPPALRVYSRLPDKPARSGPWGLGCTWDSERRARSNQQQGPELLQPRYLPRNQHLGGL